MLHRKKFFHNISHKIELQNCNSIFFEQICKVFKKHLIIVLLSGVSFSSHAQSTIRGRIMDSKTNENLIGSTVVCTKLNIGTTTDNKGFYSLKIPNGTYSLEFSFVGYDTFIKQIVVKNSDINLDVSLKKSTNLLENVIVIGKSNARKIRERAMPISVIEVKKISGTVSTVDDVLAKTSGITIRNSGGLGSGSRISLRGLEGKRIGIFIEGLPMSDNNDYNSLNTIPVDVIERIEVYKGIVPAKFGGSAIGGAVNIVLKEYPPHYLEVKYTNASYNTHKGSVGLKRNFPEKGFMFGLSGGYTYSDNNYKMELPLNKKIVVERNHDNYTKKSVGASFSSKKWWFDELELESACIFTSKDIQGIEHNIQFANQKADVLSVVNKLEKDNILIDGLDLYINTIFSYSIFQFNDTASHRYKWDMTPYVPASSFGGEIGADANSAYNKSYDFIQRTNLNYIINKSNAINLNSQYHYIKGMPTDTLRDAVFRHKTTFNSLMHSWVAGLSYEYNSANGKLANILSGKFYYYNMESLKLTHLSSPETEKISGTKSDFGISNALRYRFSDKFLVKTSLAYDIRLPNAQELLGDGFLTVSAPDLQPEKNISSNLSFMYDRFHNLKHLQIELNLFYMQLVNMIRFVPSNMLQAKYDNFGEMQSLGIELDLKFDITNWLYFFYNTTYQDLRDTRKLIDGNKRNFNYHDRMPNIPYLLANAGIELHKENLVFNNSKSRLFFNASFVEEYYYKFRQSNYDEPKIPRSVVFNLGIEQTLFDRKILLGFQMNNLTNQKILSEFNRPMPNRNYAFKIRYILKKN